MKWRTYRTTWPKLHEKWCSSYQPWTKMFKVMRKLYFFVLPFLFSEKQVYQERRIYSVHHPLNTSKDLSEVKNHLVGTVHSKIWFCHYLFHIFMMHALEPMPISPETYLINWSAIIFCKQIYCTGNRGSDLSLTQELHTVQLTILNANEDSVTKSKCIQPPAACKIFADVCLSLTLYSESRLICQLNVNLMKVFHKSG